jgi:hypothetical protein
MGLVDAVDRPDRDRRHHDLNRPSHLLLSIIPPESA